MAVLPIVLNSSVGRIGLAGKGPALRNRRQWLRAAGVEPIMIAQDSRLDGLKLLFVAGYAHARAETLVARAKAAGALVNVEDVPVLCDFHVPALVRRGDLVISVSTGGRAPGIARMLREWLDARFGPEWANYLDQASDRRIAWRAEGARAAELSERTRRLVADGNWLS
jgi:precorrin-2 dehydrogenase/sirohydrochlorin ferrochelatase